MHSSVFYLCHVLELMLNIGASEQGEALPCFLLLLDCTAAIVCVLFFLGVSPMCDPASQSFTYQLPACARSNHSAASLCWHIVPATLDLRRCLHFSRVEEPEAPPAAHNSHLSKRESNLLLPRLQSEERHVLWQISAGPSCKRRDQFKDSIIH